MMKTLTMFVFVDLLCVYDRINKIGIGGLMVMNYAVSKLLVFPKTKTEDV